MNEKIDLSGVFSLAYIKKTRYTGSFHSMRYLLALKDGQISATIYPGPYCFEVTPDDEKETKLFEYSPEGLTETVDWLNSAMMIFTAKKTVFLQETNHYNEEILRPNGRSYL